MKQAGRTAVTLAVIIICFLALQRLLMPKYMEGVTEGAFVAEYYDEEKDHDVLFFGDCEFYENVSPAVLWRDYGINSYIRGSAQQTMWQSYYLLEETLRYERPRVVVVSVFAMQYDTPQSESYNRMTLDGMRWSASKAAAVRASMTEGEHFAEYVFPMLRFHERWKELEAQDIRYYFARKKVTHNGYYLRTEVKAADTLPTPLPLSNPQFGKTAYRYLDKITALCKEQNIPLLLVKAPSLYPYWYAEWDAQMAEYARAHDLQYLNLLDLADETGLDYATDTYDGGLHLNVCGAEKVAAYLGPYLRDTYGVPDRRGETHLSEVWSEKLAEYDRDKHAADTPHKE